MPRACRSTPSRFSLALLLACSLSIQAEETPPAPETPVRPLLDERSQVDARALERQLAQREQQMLSAGGDQFLALWLPANVGDANGAVILLPGDDESADWPQSIGPLRRKLPDNGWHSLSLTLPDPQGDLPPIRTPGDETATPPGEPAAPQGDQEAPTPSTEEATATMPAAPEEAALAKIEAQRTAHTHRVLARIAAGIAFAEQRQARTIVLLGHGTGAYWAARYLAEHKPDGVKHLLLVAAERPMGFAPELDELIPGLQLPTGDFYYKDKASDRTAALLRMQAGKRQKHPAYAQIGMSALSDNAEVEQEQLYRRIRGWLDTQLKKANPAAPAAGAPAG
ncbi:MAG: alpha/beta hydrolase family protein [Pseudomonas sp.]|uniref:alpha/beta hydrolase family protein n=1 Tax=Pseudomonas sp. TaxID=306 RepID=UPI003D147E5B